MGAKLLHLHKKNRFYMRLQMTKIWEYAKEIKRCQSTLLVSEFVFFSPKGEKWIKSTTWK